MAESSFLRDASIYLGATVVFVPLARRFGLGSVLGYLAAGCAIGPFGLSLAQDAESTMHFAEFGVALMLFAIGLELDLGRLWGMRRLVFMGGTLQVTASAALLGAAALLFGLNWRGAAIAGLALALSSTASAVQTMGERNLLQTSVGKASLAILLFQDVAAIPLIGLVPLLADVRPAEGGGPWRALQVVAAIVAVVLIGRYLTRPWLRMVARSGMREVFTAFALLVVVVTAEVMSMASVSIALGAFLAGVLLASSEYRHALEVDLEPFKGLLMGLFFIAVGMSIDFGLLIRSPGLCALLLCGFVLIKASVMFALAGPLGVDARQRGLFAALLGQGGEFAFVLLGAARTVRALPGQWDALLTLVVALSLAATPLLLFVHDRVAARNARKNAREYDTIETTEAPVLIAGFGRFGQIVGRLLFASGLRATVLDHDPDQIELLRKFGFRIFYGDATRLGLLEAAGARHAKLLVNAIDDINDSLKLVDLAREHFPHLHIIARARNAQHFFELRTRGVERPERETFEAALTAGRSALQALGVDAYEAKERADRFRQYNLRNMETMVSHYRDETLRLLATKAGRDELEEQFEQDRAALERLGTAGWHEELDAADDERAETPERAEVNRALTKA
jgi:glutathione-regulated potassium-efflux system ancillary protein KefC